MIQLKGPQTYHSPHPPAAFSPSVKWRLVYWSWHVTSHKKTKQPAPVRPLVLTFFCWVKGKEKCETQLSHFNLQYWMYKQRQQHPTPGHHVNTTRWSTTTSPCCVTQHRRHLFSNQTNSAARNGTWPFVSVWALLSQTSCDIHYD